MQRIAAGLLTALFAFPLAAFERQPNADYRARRERLAEKAGAAVVVLFASTEDEGQSLTGRFRQNNDFYYLTGLNEPGAGMVIAAKSESREYTEVLFLPAQNATEERWTGPKLTAASADARAETGFNRVEALDRMRDELAHLLTPRATVYTDVSTRGSTPSTVPLQWLRRANAFPTGVNFNDAKPLIAELRLVKDPGEIALLRKAAKASVAAHQAALRAIRPGMPENELAGIIEYEFRRAGCQGPSFPSIVGSGFNSTVLHYGANSGTMQAGDVVVIDIGAECSHYAADVTRTRPVSGRFTPRQQAIYDIVLGAQQAAVKAFRSGVSTIDRTGEHSLHRVAYDYIEQHQLGRYFIHGLSHYVGLAVHDAGSRSTPLGPGMVFTIEPGIYIPEESIGVRIEDIFLVKEDGTLECLSCS